MAVARPAPFTHFSAPVTAGQGARGRGLAGRGARRCNRWQPKLWRVAPSPAWRAFLVCTQGRGGWGREGREAGMYEAGLTRACWPRRRRGAWTVLFTGVRVADGSQRGELLLCKVILLFLVRLCFLSLGRLEGAPGHAGLTTLASMSRETTALVSEPAGGHATPSSYQPPDMAQVVGTSGRPGCFLRLQCVSLQTAGQAMRHAQLGTGSNGEVVTHPAALREERITGWSNRGCLLGVMIRVGRGQKTSGGRRCRLVSRVRKEGCARGTESHVYWLQGVLRIEPIAHLSNGKHLLRSPRQPPNTCSLVAPDTDGGGLWTAPVTAETDQGRRLMTTKTSRATMH